MLTSAVINLVKILQIFSHVGETRKIVLTDFLA